jgi:prepilin-type N-terminal cleavage/methylation domain-containing protein
MRCHKGFTLIEVLIAMVVLSVGLLGVAGLTLSIRAGNSYSRNVTTATIIAQQRLEQAQRVGYVNTNTTTFPATVESVLMGGVTYSRLTTISDNMPVAKTKTVAVQVSWDSGVRSVTLSTILAES